MAIEDVKVIIGGDSSGAQEAVKSTSNALEGLQGAMHGLVGALAFERITEGFKEILGESSRADAETRRFVNTMQGVGTASNPDQFFALADSLEALNGVEAESSIAAGSMLARFNLTQAQIESLLPLTQDLAAGLGKDVTGAANDVGKAVELGSVALRGLDLGFTKSAKAAFDAASQSERVTMLMDRMSKQVGGTAAIMASTATGQFKALDIAVKNVEEAFGGVIDAPIASALHGVTSMVRDATDWFSHLSDGTKNLFGGLALGVAALGSIAAGLVAVTGAIGALTVVLPAVSAGFMAMRLAALQAWAGVLFPVTAAIAAIVGVVLIIGALRQAWAGDLGGMRTYTLNWVRDVKYLWAELVNFVRQAWSDFSDWFTEKWIISKGMMKGLSADEVGAQLQASKKGDGSKDFKADIEAAFETGKSLIAEGGSLLSSAFSSGIAGLKDIAKMLGIDLSAFSTHTVKANKPTAQTRKEGGAGGGGGVKGLDFRGEAGDMAASVALMASMAGVSEDNFQKILNSVEGDTAKAMDVATRFSGMANTVDSAASDMDRYWDSAEGQWQLTMANIQGALAQMGDKLLNNMGAGGAMIKDAMSAAATGGPFAAIGSVIMDTLAQSQSFMAVVQQFTDLISMVAQDLNPIVDALKPVIDVVVSIVKQIGGIIGQILNQVAPVIQMVGDMIAQVLVAIEPFITTLGDVLNQFISAIMPIVMAIMPIVQMVADVLSALAPILNMLLVPLQIDTAILNALKPLFDLLFVAIKYLMVGVMYVVKGIAWAYNGFLEAAAWVVNLIPGLGDVAKKIRNSKVNLDQFQINIDTMKDSTNAVPPALDRFKYNTDKAAAASEELSNVPSILKVTRLRLESAMADAAAGINGNGKQTASPATAIVGAAFNLIQQAAGTQAATDNSKTVNIESLQVNGSDGAAAADVLKKAMEAERYRLSGSTEAAPYPNATPRTAGAH